MIPNLVGSIPFGGDVVRVNVLTEENARKAMTKAESIGAFICIDGTKYYTLELPDSPMEHLTEQQILARIAG